ncbi:DNA gyrase subunit A/topoisomerase-4 subunit A [Clostridium algifaecis]|uniref:DNA topoisomerase (ATP-hydrolyzing) n=1 Tax=Clostridium algifaecis TaxID=1472040 RepID=A0ABS4KT72_9CLOT|nr:DNA topoisomerase IV subunit A [Clostridium algifaecis]MBP2033244.1 DNA gyrase subunit A/topoisomerase-4 subunit A [Clostridium algifaecis]
MVKKIIIPKDNNIIKLPIEDAMPDNYLPYAVEVAKDRALPDVRDGLKPVHRRIIYGAYMLKAFPDRPYYKSARIVGDILGKYHPHGDTSVYDAMVILAQNFTTRMPLIDGHGNWGSQDGDSAAAMRYTEARLTPIAMEMVKYIEDDVVNMVDNYSGSEKEPEVLPVRYPNLLVNGTFGIAVGLATNIPPHNLREVIDAAISLMDNPDLDTSGVMKYIKGPDLPTGGIIIGKGSLESAYSTGEGKVTLRAKTSIEKLENGRLGIVITEFPYRRSKAKLLQIISEMTADKKHSRNLEAISDIRDESDRTGIRAVIEFRKSVDYDQVEKILKYLFKKTDLQCSVSFNMVALADGKPRTLSLKDILEYFIKYQKEILIRRTKKELSESKNRFHIVEGFIKAIGIMDDIIKTIRSSKSKKDAASNLMDKFEFTKIQAEAILELMLYRLTGLEIVEFEKEHRKLEKHINSLELILKSEKEQFKVIKSELREIRDKYGDDRKTDIIEDDNEAKINVEETIVEEDIIVTMSNEGFIKRISKKSYNRSTKNVEEIEYREGDYNRFLINSNTKNTLMLFTDMGNMYKLRGIDIPELKWREKGEKIDNVVKGLNTSEEKIVSFINLEDDDYNSNFMMFTSTGGIKKTSIEKFSTNYTKLMAIKLKKDEKLIDVKLTLKDRKEAYLDVTTKIGLKFTIPEPEIDLEDRNIVSTNMFSMPEVDEVIGIRFGESGIQKRFYVSIDKNGILKSSEKACRTFGTYTNSNSHILLFTKKGDVFSIPSVMLQNLDGGISITDLFEIPKKSSILSIMSIENFKNGYIYFFTQQGMIKKTELSEFSNIKIKQTAYKFKDTNDILIDVKYSEKENTEIMVLTKNGLEIKFSSNDVNPTGKIAAGAAAINLKDDDKVICAFIIENEDTVSFLDVKCKNGKKLKIKLKDIKIQNRGGKGKSIINEDYNIENVTLK